MDVFLGQVEYDLWRVDSRALPHIALAQPLRKRRRAKAGTKGAQRNETGSGPSEQEPLTGGTITFEVRLPVEGAVPAEVVDEFEAMKVAEEVALLEEEKQMSEWI